MANVATTGSYAMYCNRFNFRSTWLRLSCDYQQEKAGKRQRAPYHAGK
jgi:hypothetical protein